MANKAKSWQDLNHTTNLAWLDMPLDDGDVDSSEQNGSEIEDTPESPSSASLLQMPVRRRTMSMGAQSDEVDDNFHELQPVTDEPARKRFRHGSLGSEFDEADSGW